MTNFVEFQNYKIIYRRYAGLYFCLGVDIDENSLGYLEILHDFVEILNEYFHNVCELDLVFNFYKVYSVVDEMFLAGEIRETSQTKVLKQLLVYNSLEWTCHLQKDVSGIHQQLTSLLHLWMSVKKWYECIDDEK